MSLIFSLAAVIALLLVLVDHATVAMLSLDYTNVHTTSGRTEQLLDVTTTASRNTCIL